MTAWREPFSKFSFTDSDVCREFMGVGSQSFRYSFGMNRKVKYLFLFIIASLCSTTTIAQDKAARDRLFTAHGQYYTPTANGLKSFQCEATIDWKAMLSRFGGTEIPADNPLLKYLQTVHLTVVDELKGTGSIEWSETGVPPEGKEQGVKQMRDGLQTMMGGFFQSWNAYMSGAMVPFPDDSTEVTTAEAGIHLHATSDNMNVDEDFDKIMLLTQAVVVTPELKVVAVPIYVRTDDGLIISAVTSQLHQPPSAPPVEVTFRVEYAKVGAFQIPSHIVYDVKNVGVIEVGFNSCQVSVVNSTQKPAAEKSNLPTN